MWLAGLASAVLPVYILLCILLSNTHANNVHTAPTPARATISEKSILLILTGIRVMSCFETCPKPACRAFGKLDRRFRREDWHATRFKIFSRSSGASISETLTGRTAEEGCAFLLLCGVSVPVFENVRFCCLRDVMRCLAVRRFPAGDMLLFVSHPVVLPAAHMRLRHSTSLPSAL